MLLHKTTLLEICKLRLLEFFFPFSSRCCVPDIAQNIVGYRPNFTHNCNFAKPGPKRKFNIKRAMYIYTLFENLINNS